MKGDLPIQRRISSTVPDAPGVGAELDWELIGEKTVTAIVYRNGEDIEMDRELTGRQGIITGGSSGIGYAMANELADAGAIVYVISRSGRVKDGLPESHEGVIHLKGDVTDRKEMQEEIDGDRVQRRIRIF